MQWTHKLSLRRKLMLVIMINTVLALCAAGIGFAEYGAQRFRQVDIQDLNALAKILGTDCAAPLTFKDPNSAQDILQALAVKPHIRTAVIYDRDDKPFAIYQQGGANNGYIPPPVKGDVSRFTSDSVLIFQGIIFDGEKIGTVYLDGDQGEDRQLLRSYLQFFGFIIVVVSLGAYVMAGRLQRPISDPILQLAWTMKMVTSTRDYSIQAAKHSEDEVGALIDGFNEMLGEIRNRDTELRGARQDLERRVEKRTAELEQEIADRRRAQEALKESEGRIRLLLDSTAEAIFGIDRDGMITFCNPATLRLLGQENGAELLGKSAHHIMHHSRADGTIYPIEECPIVESRSMGAGVHLDNEVFWRADGTSFAAEYWAFPIRREGEIVGAVVTFLDITDRKRAQAALLESKEAAEAGSRAKSEFLANMSHEIRTPLNGIIGMTDLVLDTKVTDEQRDYLNLVKSSADSLLHVINDILDFSKIEAGKLELEKTEFEIRDVFRDTLKTLAQRTDNKELGVSARVAPSVPRTLIGDPTRLRQIVVNLVGNAIKFTEQGNVVLNTELDSSTGDVVRLHISVSDTGMGIPVAKQQIIFDSFAQVDGSTTRRFGGTGLGLTISRQLVDLMGGRIWVESEVGKGSTFHFTCNLQRGTATASHQEQVAGRSLPGMKVLVVDTNEINRGIVSEMLKNWGMNATQTDSGQGALELLQAAKNAGQAFPIVVMDSDLPGFDGFQVFQEIQLAPGLAGAVVMLLARKRQLADRERCRAMGAKYFLMKPIGQSELLDAILLSLGKNAIIEENLVEPLVLLREKPKTRLLNILLAEDNAVNQKLAIRLLEKAGHRVTLARTGTEVIAAWETAVDPEIDLVLMDIQMPELDGMEATRAIRAREKNSGRHVPVVAMTAHAMHGDKERCLANGMDGYVSKPIHPTALFAEIDRCLGALEKSQPVTENTGDLKEFIDRESLLERVEGDRELLTEMIHLFQDDVPKMLSTMRESLERGDMAVLERTAHSMKGATGNLSAKRAAAAAMNLEKDANNKDAEAAKESLAEVERSIKLLLPALSDLCVEVTK